MASVTYGLDLPRALDRLLARESFDIVHVHNPMTPVLPLLALHHATGPVVGTFHAHARPGVVLRVARGMAQRYLDRLDAAVAPSRGVLGRLEGRLRGDVRFREAVDELWPFALGVLSEEQRSLLGEAVDRDEVEAIGPGERNDLRPLWEEMTMVRRSVPGASW